MKRRASHLGWLAVLLLGVAASLSVEAPARADTRRVQEVDGKEASLALLERKMKDPEGVFCGAKHSKLLVRVDEQGEGTISLEDGRDVAEERVLRVARSLRRNRSVTVLYCEGTGEGSVATATNVSRFAWKEKKGWTASVVKTGKPIVAAQSQGPEKPSDAEIDETLAHGSRAINKTVPMMLDKETRLDSTEASNKVFLQNFTLIKYESSEIHAPDFRRSMKPKIARGACEDEVSRFFLQNGVRYSYRYHGKDGKEITTITVGSGDCK